MKKLFAVVVALTGMLLLTYGAQGQAQAQGADDAGQVEAGQAVYAASCAGCHGDDGTGVAGQGRPLIGIASQGDRETHVASITGGKGGMPAFGPRISVDEINRRHRMFDSRSSTTLQQLKMTLKMKPNWRRLVLVPQGLPSWA